MGLPVIDVGWTLAFILSLLEHADKKKKLCLLISKHQFSEFALNVSCSSGIMKVQDHTSKNVKVGFNPRLVIHNTGFSVNSTLMAVCLPSALAQQRNSRTEKPGGLSLSIYQKTLPSNQTVNSRQSQSGLYSLKNIPHIHNELWVNTAEQRS